MLGADLRWAAAEPKRGSQMTRAGRRLVVVAAVAAVAVAVSACKVLQRSAPTSGALTAAVADAPVPGADGDGDTPTCPLGPAEVSAALGGVWAVSSRPSGGCDYTYGGRTILVSTVPLPGDAAGHAAALARVRQPCDAGSTQVLPVGGFVCRRDTLFEAATVAGDRLLVLCTSAGSDPAQARGLQVRLGTLLAAITSR
jgi:hypothetical protein